MILEHSNQIRSVKCTQQSISVTFTSSDAFHIAEQTWDPKNGPFILATYHVGCGNVLEGMRSFFRASIPTFDLDSLSVRLHVSRISNAQAIQEADVAWGTYKAPSTSRKRSTPVRRAIQAAQPATVARAASIVDLTTSFDALECFFNIEVDNKSAITGVDLPDYVTEVDGDVYDGTSDDGQPIRRGLEKSWFFSWVVDTVVKIVKVKLSHKL